MVDSQIKYKFTKAGLKHQAMVLITEVLLKDVSVMMTEILVPTDIT